MNNERIAGIDYSLLVNKFKYKKDWLLQIEVYSTKKYLYHYKWIWKKQWTLMN